MLEYFTKFKKNKTDKDDKEAKGKGKQADEDVTKGAEQAASSTSDAVASPPAAAPLLDDEDERFLEHLTSSSPHVEHDDADGTTPPLPPRVGTPDLSWDSDTESFRRVDIEDSLTDKDKEKEREKGKDKDKEEEKEEEKDKDKDKDKDSKDKGSSKKTNRLSFFKRKSKKSDDASLTPADNKLAVPVPEAEREKDDLTRVLDNLNLAARNNKAFSLSDESTELVRKFTIVLKDLVNGVPTAVHDLTSLLDDSDGELSKNYEKLPKSFKKLVTQLPEKLSSTLAPELLAAAAESQGLSAAEVSGAQSSGVKGAAKRLFAPRNLKDLVTKPGAVVSMLKGIVNALKMRWPAFIGTNVIWSLALFLLMFVLWYCHKRGREVRLEKEKSGKDGAVDGSDRIEELPDDPALPAPVPAGSAAVPIVIEPAGGEKVKTT